MVWSLLIPFEIPLEILPKLEIPLEIPIEKAMGLTVNCSGAYRKQAGVLL